MRAKPDHAEGKAAAAQAEVELQRAEAQWPEVRRLHRELSDQRRANHFAEKVAQLFRGAPS